MIFSIKSFLIYINLQVFFLLILILFIKSVLQSIKLTKLLLILNFISKLITLCALNKPAKPAVVPKIPIVSHLAKSGSFLFGNIHSKHRWPWNHSKRSTV